MYWLARLSLRVLLGLLFHVRIDGLEHLPAPPYVLAANHLSWVDPLIVACWLPQRITWIGAEEYSTRLPLVGSFLRRLGVVLPIRRGCVVQSALSREVTAVLAGGGVVGVFPEGRVGRWEGLLLPPLKKGVAHFALKARVPVVPVALYGTTDLYLRRRMRLRVLSPVPAGLGSTADEVLAVLRIRLWLALRDLAEHPPRQPSRKWWRWLGRVVR